MNTVARLRRWADARERRDPRHGKTGTRLLRTAADIIENDTLSVAELRTLEGFVAETIEWTGDGTRRELREIAAKLNRMILKADFGTTTTLDRREWPEYAEAMKRDEEGPDLNSDDLYDTLRSDHDQLD